MHLIVSITLCFCLLGFSTSNEVNSKADLELERIDCYPEAPYSFGQPIDQRCRQRNCIYQSSSKPGVPWCFFPQETFGYTMTNYSISNKTFRISLRHLTKYPSNFGPAINNLVLQAEYLNAKTFHLKIYDADKDRYEVPIELKNVRDNSQFDPDFKFEFENRQTDSVFVFRVIRKSTGTVLFDTSIGGFVFSDQFLQIASVLPDGSNVYGFGENNHPSLSHDMNFKLWGMFARDEPNVAGENLNQYGVQPVYQVLESDGNTHGVAFINSNAMEYSFTPRPALILRSIGGIFDFYFFSGPEPETVVQQYTALVGLPVMIPYWSLGFQLSRWDYKDLNDMKRVVQRNLDAGIPLDIQYADIEHYQNQMDFTISQEKFKELPQYFRELQSKGMHVVPILDPALVVDRGNLNYKPYLTGVQNDVYIKWPQLLSPDFAEFQNDYMIGYCWPDDKVVYPDFFNNRTQQWWIDLITDYRKVNITFDALWIDMNEPAVFGTNEVKPENWPDDRLPYWSLKCPTNKWDDPPYRTINAYRYDSSNKQKRLSEKTLCMIGLQKDGKYRHYDVHSLYGLSESIVTIKAARQATGKRSFILSRSTYLGSGHYGGHWLGDNDSSFKDLHRSIIGMIEYGIFGIPYVGADICGFTSVTTEELCQRWQQVGAFYPYSRNHNVRGSPDQDPAAFSQSLIDSTKRTLNIRYTILPYYYTLFYKAHTSGSLVIKGLYQEFPRDANCRKVDKQFLVGPAFLVSPVVEQGKTTVDAYLPTSSKWYSYYDGSVASKGFVKLSAPLDFIPLHVRGGYIIPTQEPANNTYFSRQKPFGLIVALDQYIQAKGELFYDDGDSIDSIEKSNYYYSSFLFESNQLKMTVGKNNYADIGNLKLDTIRIFGFTSQRNLHVEIVSQSRSVQVVNITNVNVNQFGEIKLSNLNLKMTENFEINFKSVNVPEVVNLNDERLRADCFPDPGAYQSKCQERGCVWSPSQTPGIPWCYFGKNKASYSLDGAPITTQVEPERLRKEYVVRKTDSASLYGEDVNRLKITVEHKGEKMVRVKIEDAEKKRFEVPVQTSWKNTVTNNEGKVQDNDLDVKIESDSLGRFVFEVYRKSTGVRLFSTREFAESFVFSDRYIHFFARLASENVFGFGENTHETFRHRFEENSVTFPVFARDEPPSGGAKALYGTQPFYMCVEKDGSAHGILIMNSNAQEYRLFGLQSLMYRTLGGVLDFYIFSGPNPESVIQQYSNLIGTPFMPPYYALGFQLSRYGYNNIGNIKAAIDRTLAANIPFDIQHGDIDHFERQKDFTYDKANFNGLPEYVAELKSKGIRFIPIVDPALVTNEPNYMPYVRGMQKDVWIKWPIDLNPQAQETVNRNMLGYVWPEGKVLFPDFFNNKTIQWWSDEIENYYQTLFKFEGLWIDMNEPANFGTNLDKPFNWPSNLPPWSLKCPNNRYDDPPYRTGAAFGERLSDKTLCLVGEQTDGVNVYKQYDVHNLFGYTQTLATHKALLQTRPNKRPLIITRSTFPGSGSKAGHWLGDNTSAWKHLKYNIIGLLEFNLFLIPYVGADICGFFGDADAELCERWMQLGAFNPFFRNHNGLYGTNQDPGAFGSVIAESMRKTVFIRYTLLPYLYTLFYNVHTKGGTVVRSLIHEFPRDRRTYDIDEQFLWGSALLISPVIYQGKTSVEVYFPLESRWFSYYDGREVNPDTRWVSAPRDFIPLHVRGGYILPTQEPGNNTDSSRKNPFGLIVAPDSVGNSTGSLYWDDGESFNSISSGAYSLYDFAYSDLGDESLLSIIVKKTGFANSNRLNKIRIFSVKSLPTKIILDSTTTITTFTFNELNKELLIENANLSLSTNHILRIEF